MGLREGIIAFLKFNPHHEPAGSPVGGQFAHGPNGAYGAALQSVGEVLVPNTAMLTHSPQYSSFITGSGELIGFGKPSQGLTIHHDVALAAIEAVDEELAEEIKRDPLARLHFLAVPPVLRDGNLRVAMWSHQNLSLELAHYPNEKQMRTLRTMFDTSVRLSNRVHTIIDVLPQYGPTMVADASVEVYAESWSDFQRALQKAWNSTLTKREGEAVEKHGDGSHDEKDHGNREGSGTPDLKSIRWEVTTQPGEHRGYKKKITALDAQGKVRSVTASVYKTYPPGEKGYWVGLVDGHTKVGNSAKVVLGLVDEFLEEVFGRSNLAKHAEHDQKDHGNWADGESVADAASSNPNSKGKDETHREHVKRLLEGGILEDDDLDWIKRNSSGPVEEQWLVELLVDQQEFQNNNPDKSGCRVGEWDTKGTPVPAQQIKEQVLSAATQGWPSRLHGGGDAFAKFLVKHGEAFTVPDEPPAIELGYPKECYANAARFVLHEVGGVEGESGLTYVEGYVLSPKTPNDLIHHAWLVDKQNKVVDPTLGWAPSKTYFGVKMPNRDMRKATFKSGMFGITAAGSVPVWLRKHVAGEKP